MSRTKQREQTRLARIRDLNDSLRTTLNGGRVLLTQGVLDQGAAFNRAAFLKVRAFAAFDSDNDPHCEHDFGSLTVSGKKVFFKIDYYDNALAFGSPDPADPSVTTRVMTIMLAEEY